MVQVLFEERAKRKSGEPVTLGEEGNLLAFAEADGVGGAATGGTDVVDVEQRYGGRCELK